LELAVIGLVDSTGILVEPAGVLSDHEVLSAVDAKKSGASVNSLPGGIRSGDPMGALNLLASRLGDDTIVVDCTASTSTVPALLYALECGSRLVLANKKPLTMSQEVYDRLTRAGDTEGPVRLDRARWETTCGAGLPVIVTLHRLLTSGDEVRRIAGAFSGTLGFVMTGLQSGRPFSQVVREAHRLGYTEPDPRDDLGGVDVARKSLILARQLGWRLELDDVAVEGLYPAEMDGLSVGEFLEALPALDSYFAGRVAEASAQGGVLRFAAVLEEGRCKVGPVVAPAGSPLGQLSGTDNLVEFHSRWYSPNPLVVQGRGAGTDATAAGVLADVVELAFSRQ
jgi:aspartokinase/homoserine dehydrogenase 1